LVITPAAPIGLGQRFTVVVHNFTAKPTTPLAGEEGTTAFFITPDGSATAGQPNLMHSVYPCNDYPSKKATFSFCTATPTWAGSARPPSPPAPVAPRPFFFRRIPSRRGRTSPTALRDPLGFQGDGGDRAVR
jgi:hypothetical protein